ncbi:MAG: hypothetical protein ACO3XO_10565 [Bdellovibrionota bacterium]
MKFDRDPTPLPARRQFEQALAGAELPATHVETNQALELLESLLERHPSYSKSLLGTMDLVRDSAESIDAIRFGGLTGAESLMEEAHIRKMELTERLLEEDIRGEDSSQKLLSTLLQSNLSLGNALSFAERSLRELSNPREVVRLTRIALYHYTKGIRRILSEIHNTDEDS